MIIPDFIDGIPIDEYRVNMVKMPKEELEKLYLEQKKTISQIAKHFNCHYRTVYARLKRLNIPIRQGRPKKKPRIHLGHIELAEMLKTKYSIDEIAKKLRTKPETVRLFIRKYGL
ncbi:helix-turn-helix domain-containing protein [Candidatus Woesearchaeota archaeon]|nr:helix-turn-helix domain-containing protein [Candidatus Woesearchaeota archaeon]